MATKIKRLADLNRVLPLTVIAGGVEQQIDGAVLSARRVEEIERLTPIPDVPREKNAEGEVVEKADDPAYVAARDAAWRKRMYMIVCATLGSEFFGTEDMELQEQALDEQMSPEQILSLFRQIRTASTVVRADVEAAKAEIRPTAATSAEAATSA